MPLSVPRAGLVLWAAVTALGPATPSATGAGDRGSAAGRSNDCPAAQVRLFVDRDGSRLRLRGSGSGRPVCVPAAGVPRARQRDLARNPLVPVKHRRALRRGVLARAAGDRTAARLAAAALRKGPATTARTQDETITPRREVAPGRFAHEKYVRTNPDDDEVGTGNLVHVVADMDAADLGKGQPRGRTKIVNTETVGTSAFVRRCPEPGGVLPLEYAEVLAQSTSVITGPKTVRFGLEVEVQARGKAQVEEDARAKLFGYRMNAVIRYFGGAAPPGGGDRAPDLVWRGTFSDEDVPVAGNFRTDAFKGSWRSGNSRMTSDQQVYLAALASGYLSDARRHLRKWILKAEESYWDRKECVKVVLLPESPGDFETGGTERVTVEAVMKADGSPAGSGVVKVHPNFSGCAEVIEPYSGPAPSVRFTMRDTTRIWKRDDPPCFGAEAITNRGRADLQSMVWPEQPPEPQFPWRFEILDASIQTTTTASKMNGYCDPVGPVSGSIRFGGAFASGLPSQIDRLGDGSLSGVLAGKVRAAWTDHRLSGCRSAPGGGGLQPCTRTMPDRAPGPDGTDEVQVAVRAPSATAKTATLTWDLASPSVGFFDAGDDECNVSIVGMLPAQQQTVPMATFASGAPQALEFTGSEHLDVDDQGDPASIDYAWTLRLTIRRVQDGG